MWGFGFLFNKNTICQVCLSHSEKDTRGESWDQQSLQTGWKSTLAIRRKSFFLFVSKIFFLNFLFFFVIVQRLERKSWPDVWLVKAKPTIGWSAMASPDQFGTFCQTFVLVFNIWIPITHQFANFQKVFLQQHWIVKDAAQGCVVRHLKVKLHFELNFNSVMMIVNKLQKLSLLFLLSLTSFQRNEENCIWSSVGAAICVWWGYRLCKNFFIASILIWRSRLPTNLKQKRRMEEWQLSLASGGKCGE